MWTRCVISDLFLVGLAEIAALREEKFKCWRLQRRKKQENFVDWNAWGFPDSDWRSFDRVHKIPGKSRDVGGLFCRSAGAAHLAPNSGRNDRLSGNYIGISRIDDPISAAEKENAQGSGVL